MASMLNEFNIHKWAPRWSWMRVECDVWGWMRVECDVCIFGPKCDKAPSRF